MNQTMKWLLSAALSSVALAGCSDAGTPSEGTEETGSLSLQLTRVPANAACLQIDINGSRSVTRRIDLSPTEQDTMQLDGLPIGQLSVSGQAYASACNAVLPTAVPSYAVEKAIVAEVRPGVVTSIVLNLLANGRAGIEAEFEAPAACRTEAQLTGMTFNIRYDSGPSGNNAWNRAVNPRRERVISVMKDSQADFIGLQEVLANQADDLVAALTDYSFFGVGRDDGVRKGEFAGIFYRSDRFELLDGNHFWLSETPEVPGTVFPGSGSIRLATWVRLLDLRANRTFLLLNTHWDNVSQSSREKSGALIRERLAGLAQGDPVIVTGDFNTTESNTAVLNITSGAPATAPLLRDAYRLVHTPQEQAELTFHNFNGATVGQRIDFVLHNDDLKPLAAAIVRTSFEGLYPSDHYPVTAKLAWTNDGVGTACP